jgi:hypothetical protein
MSSSCMFNPPSIAAGAGTTPVCLTITTKGPNAGNGSSIQRRADGRAPWLPLTLPMAGIIVAGMVGGRVSRRWAAAGLCVCWVLIGLMLACGGLGSNSSPPPSPPPAVTVTVSPGTTVNLWPTVAGWPAQTQTFTATVGNASNTAVNWTVPSGGGSIDSNGNYTAPGTVPNPATIAVTATSVADPSRSGSATVNIQTPTTLGTFNVTVTATEGTIARSQGVTLTVQ